MAGGDPTTVQLSHETKNRLEERGSKGDTFEEIIVDLLEQTENDK